MACGEQAPSAAFFECLDGVAWAADGALVACARGVLPFKAAVVSRVLDGSPLDRVLAAREIADGAIALEAGDNCVVCGDMHLLHGERFLERIYPRMCKVCGRDHWYSHGYRWLQAGRAIDVRAIDALRGADLTFRDFRHLDVDVRRRGRKVGGLPVRASRDETLRAQVAFAVFRRRVG